MPKITTPLHVLRQLPKTQQLVVAQEHIDIMGHMNTMHYWEMFSRASRALTSMTGVNADYVAQRRRGAFMLRNFTQFIAEAHLENELIIYTRLVAYSDKRYQYMHFMVNETTDQLAATMEVLSTHANLDNRRSAPFSPDIITIMDAMIADHNRLDWSGAPLSGVLAP